jgi:putative endopeptidase
MKSGITTSDLDPSVRPQDDFFGHVNGQWVVRTPIPSDRGRYGTFDILREAALHDVREIVEDVAAASPEPGSVGAKVGDLWTSFMDEDAVEALGAGPLADDLAAVDGLTDVAEVPGLLGRLQRRDVDGVVLPFVKTDDRDAESYVVYLEQAGIGLPDESYYREESSEPLRTAYVEHVERMLALAGVEDAGAASQRVMALETRLASSHWDNVTTRDPVRTYTKVSRAELAELSAGVDWDAYLDGLEVSRTAFDSVVVRQPSFLTGLAEALREEPLDVWQDWLRWKIVHAAAPYLSGAFVAENFAFYGKTLSGVPEIQDRWKRGVNLLEGAIGQAVGQLYVERHFPPEAKERMLDLVGNLVEAFRRDFQSLEWMGEGTRAEALAKLERFRPKIGYPDEWRDYSSLEIDPADLVGNVRRAAAFEVDRQFGHLGQPIDRGEWFMTPQTVNAYYNPGMNEIVFPAAILQPPFFDVEADDAVNYGGIGAVIGHEVGHGFDDQGSKFDGLGNLREWWTDEDRARFEELSHALAKQFDGLETRDVPGRKVNGALTVGENIGDLGGLAIGLAAYRIATEGEEPPEIDGLTGEQRFFVGWAQVWRGVARREEAERLLTIDPHSPVDLRANAVRNIDAFHEAFGTTPSDGMWLDPDERVRIF